MSIACGLMAASFAFPQSTPKACAFGGGEGDVKYINGDLTDANGVLQKTLEIRVIFSKGPAAEGSADWEVIDTTAGSVFHIKAPATLTGADVPLSLPLDPNHKYALTAFGLPGCDPDKPPVAMIAGVHAVGLGPSPPLLPSARTTAGPRFAVSPSKARTDSDLYLSGLITGATGQKAAYTADIKTQFDYVLRQAHDNQPQLSLLPSFDFTASTNSKQNGNSVTFGLAVRSAWAQRVGPLGALDMHTVLEPGGAVQADPYFRVIEPVFRLPIYALTTPQQWGPFLIYLQPMFGTEAGESTKMPSPSDYATVPAGLPGTRGIFRLFAGGTLLINVNKNSKTGSGTKTIFSLETDYINRWPMTAEPLFSQASTGKLLLLGIGTQPRGYVTTKIERDLGSYFSIALEHDYGELPPLYTKVDNKYCVSLTYKASLKAGAK